MSQMFQHPLRVGDRIEVPFATGLRPAVVMQVRGGLVHVRVDPDSEFPVYTFYRLDELVCDGSV